MTFRNITISTDISHDPHSRRAAYAFWISTEMGPIKRSGMFKEKCRCPTEAELKCIANAVAFFRKTGIEVEHLIINTDSLVSIKWATAKGKGKSTSHRFKVVVDFIKETVFGNYKQVTFRHVKAHAGTNNKRSYVNDWCDKEAKRVLREFRNKKK